MELYADADVVTGYFEDGSPFTFHATFWGTFTADVRPIPHGTSSG